MNEQDLKHVIALLLEDAKRLQQTEPNAGTEARILLSSWQKLGDSRSGQMKGFTWVKLNQLAEHRINKALAEGKVADFYDFLDLLNAETRMNDGNHTRANTEDLLIATCGRGLERMNASIKQVVYSSLGAHSEKP
jgi:hypothetical protein